ncbi:hypothetical protein A2865_04305 [Candidatus Woesebacteria bacterium RIFCSPHIGHO2_01_FULL_39_17]|nr:MAG: hypothetical protein A2865_04305 [Candidatus Woesebacteria bacterium RIFCSPHIGHO2_01_FULL_39_17]
MNKDFFRLSILAFLVITGAILVTNLGKPQFLKSRAQTYSLNTGCTSISLNPNREIYTSGESVDITVVGYGQDLSRIVLWYTGATEMLTKSTISSPANWINIPGNYNAQTKTWTGSWAVPADGEYIITPNFIQTNDLACSSNPAYTCSGCERGHIYNRRSSTDPPYGTYSCNGCYKTLVSSQNASRVGGYNIREYFNFSPGFSWLFNGVNIATGETKNFTTKLEIEEASRMCNKTLLPLRMTKTNIYGYWQPFGHNNNPGNYNTRHLLSYFNPGESWSDRTMGVLFHKAYIKDFSDTTVNQLMTLGTYDPNWVNIRSFSDDGIHTFESNYFSPYLWGEMGAYDGYRFQRIHRIWGYSGSQCQPKYVTTGRESWWEMSYHNENVQTPAYTGPAVRIRVFEAGYPIGSESWVTREDWYLARNLGPVQIEKRGLQGLCHTNPPDPDCFSTSKMARPEITMQLADYYVGGPLQIRLSTDSVYRRGRYTLYAKALDKAGNYTRNYTGWLEVIVCINDTPCEPDRMFKWNEFVQNGVANVDLSKFNLASGLRQAKYRPWIEKPPSDVTGEASISSTQLPWSNKVLLRLTD